MADQRWRRSRRFGRWLWPPQPKPREFLLSRDDIVGSLFTDDADKALVLYEEAQASHREAAERADSAERRATVLQGSVAIALSVSLGGSALLLDPSKIHGHQWRLLFLTALGGVVVCLTISGYRALLATSRRFSWSAPAAEDILTWKSTTIAQIRIDRAADYLLAYSINDRIASAKVALMAEAVQWFLGALIFIGVLLALAISYAAFGYTTTARHHIDTCHSAYDRAGRLGQAGLPVGEVPGFSRTRAPGQVVN